MVECQWDSVVLSPYSPVLTGLELTFMGLTESNSSLCSTPGFVVSHVGKRERGGERREGGKKGIEKERKEGRRNKERKKDRKEEGIQGESRKEKKKEKVFCWL